jgi:predicted nucleic acid-binding protein
MADLLLDSNVLILHLRKRGSASEFLLQWGKKDKLYISVVTRTEILAGMHAREERATTELLAAMPSLSIAPGIADRAGRLIYNLARNGVQFSFPDALIAATALEHDLTLVTTNARHFPVEGLSVKEFGGGQKLTPEKDRGLLETI